MVEENEKLKRTLKRLFENQEYETSFEDVVYDHDGFSKYVFKYYCVIDKVLGEWPNSVVSVDIYVIEFTIDGEDNKFDDSSWYKDQLEDLIYDKLFSDFPLSFYLEFYREPDSIT